MNKNYLTIIKAGYRFDEVEMPEDHEGCLYDDLVCNGLLDEYCETGVIEWTMAVGIVKGALDDGQYEDSSRLWLCCSKFDLGPGTGRADELDRAFKHAPAGSELDRDMALLIANAKHFAANLAAAEAAELAAATSKTQAASKTVSGRL